VKRLAAIRSAGKLELVNIGMIEREGGDIRGAGQMLADKRTNRFFDPRTA
jgi:hypothetical protein